MRVGGIRVMKKFFFLQIMSGEFQKLQIDTKTDYNEILNLAFKHYIKGDGGDIFKKKLYTAKKNKSTLMFYLFTFVSYLKRIIPNNFKYYLKSTFANKENSK